MQDLVDFFSTIGKLKGMPKRGWVINDIKKPESIAEHSFRCALMSWFFAKKKGLDSDKIIKMALIHDLCAVYAKETTPYETFLPANKKQREKIMKTWPRFSQAQKQKIAKARYQKDKRAIERLVVKLPADLKKEILALWFDYEKGLTPEGRFFQQSDRVENFLQANEYWQKYGRPHQKPWWLWAREFFDDPLLLSFIDDMAKNFHRKTPH